MAAAKQRLNLAVPPPPRTPRHVHSQQLAHTFLPTSPFPSPLNRWFWSPGRSSVRRCRRRRRRRRRLHVACWAFATSRSWLDRAACRAIYTLASAERTCNQLPRSTPVSAVSRYVRPSVKTCFKWRPVRNCSHAAEAPWVTVCRMDYVLCSATGWLLPNHRTAVVCLGMPRLGDQ